MCRCFVLLVVPHLHCSPVVCFWFSLLCVGVGAVWGLCVFGVRARVCVCVCGFVLFVAASGAVFGFLFAGLGSCHTRCGMSRRRTWSETTKCV